MTVAIATCSSPSTMSVAPFKLTGNLNPQRSHLFSTFAFHSDPVPHIPPVPHSTPVTPFTTTILPLSSPTLCFQVRRSPPPPAPARHPLPHTHSGRTSLRHRSSPSHYPTAPPAVLSLAHHRDVRYQADPHTDSSPLDLHRSSRPLPHTRPWRATASAPALFNDERGGWGPDERRPREVSGMKDRVKHREAWRGGVGGKGVSDGDQLGGRVERYRASPWAVSEGLRAGLAEEGMRGGYRAECGQAHVPMRVGAHAATMSSRRFHSSRSGVCHHHCTQGL